MEGDTGPDGDGGDMGPTGPKGFKGPKGMKGVKAQKGVKGPKGPLGDKGNKGLKGFKGFKGDINPGKGNGRRRRRSVTVRYQKSSAGFTHVLGDSGSLQLLDDVRRGRQRGVKMRCRRQKNSCFLEYLSSVQQ
ncbi:hypothetical protein HAZT_HAZT004567 [Hyalella azteca]|uniref:Uncharacterized protein n=1 Tax=Hyalella azteca TaxID=294128 RepID=A0A6A0HF51_HYAAZ|nr:hypothetical protein HAZT_HAZT004567 [Hyalella azteca]